MFFKEKRLSAVAKFNLILCSILRAYFLFLLLTHALKLTKVLYNVVLARAYGASRNFLDFLTDF